jgi:hypothetical protein
VTTPDDSDSGGSKRPLPPSDPWSILPEELNERVKKRVRKFSTEAQDKIVKYRADPDKNPTGKEVAEIYSKAVKFAPPTGPFVPGIRSDTRLPRTGAGRSVGEVPKGMQFAGVKQAGKWAEKGRASGRGPKSDTRDLQLLNQISQAMINFVVNTQEVEAMAVNGRIIVSANEKATIQKIGQAKLDEILKAEAEDDFQQKKDKISSVGAALTVGDGDLSDLERTGIDRLSRMETDSHFSEDQASGVKSVLETLAATLGKRLEIVNGGSPETVAGMITDVAYQGRIITIDANTKMVKVKGKDKEASCTHAEQNLVYALVLAGYGGGASIAGGKRPCTVCWLSLQLASSKGYKIRFNSHPGGYWSSTTLEGLRLIAEALGFDEDGLKDKVQELATGFIQYATDPDVLGPSDVDLVEGVISGDWRTDMGTPSQSPEHYPYSPGSPEPEVEAEKTFSLTYVGATGGAPDPGIGDVTLDNDGTKKTIGRNKGDIVLSHPTVSRTHGSIWAEGGTVKLSVDGGNTRIDANGTGAYTAAPAGTVYTLTAGSQFTIGAYIWKVLAT